ncbi:hypothetical protein A2U01_0105039, partial [Trifolium medium]|nr:hypothetical protein [Trifolium medium]
VSASARRKKAAENPPKKRARKSKEARADDDETAHPAPEHHEGDPAQAVPAQANAMEEGHSGDDRDNIVLE